MDAMPEKEPILKLLEKNSQKGNVQLVLQRNSMPYIWKGSIRVSHNTTAVFFYTYHKHLDFRKEKESAMLCTHVQAYQIS